jgi:hypothetical protein
VSKQAFERKLAELTSLRDAPESEAAAAFKKALRDRNNFYVSKVAKLIRERRLASLTSEILAAYDRFFDDPVKSDPQCWAKNELARTLVDLEYRDPAPFLRGVQHVQMEPVWGGEEDTATTLRSVCVLALAGCALPAHRILELQLELLADPSLPVRIDAVRAIASVGGPEALLMLRLKSLLGDKESQVTGQCLQSLLELDAEGQLPFASRFLASRDQELRMEAIASIALCDAESAVTILSAHLKHERATEARELLVKSLGASKQEAAASFLLELIATARGPLAATAVEALAGSRFRETFRDRVQKAVESRTDEEVRRAWNQLWLHSR